MPPRRSLRVTPGAWAVILGLALPLAAASAGPAAADAERELRRASRPDLAVEERVASALRALASPEPLRPALAVRAGASLLERAPDVGAALVKRGADDGWLDPETAQAARDRLRVAGEAARSEEHTSEL